MTRNLAIGVSAALLVVALGAAPAKAQVLPYIPLPNGLAGTHWVNPERLLDPTSNIAIPGTKQWKLNPATGQWDYFYIDINGRPRWSASYVNPVTGGIDRVTRFAPSKKGIGKPAQKGPATSRPRVIRGPGGR